MATSLMTLGIALMAQASAFRGDSKVVGGFNITLDRVPFLVSIQLEELGHYCGGSLITLKHVLTACHCAAVLKVGSKHENIVLRNVTLIFVVAGVENVVTPNRSDPFYQKRQASRLAIHPKCEQIEYIDYDFGLIYMRTRFNKSEKVKPFIFNLQLVRTKFGGSASNDPGPDEEECYVAGWGVTRKESFVVSTQLKAARMRIITDQECSRVYGLKDEFFIDYRFVTHAQMCVLSHGHKQNDSDCDGDSGGPYYCNNTVFGVVSYGYDCGNWDTPHAYAKFLFAIKWLEDEKIIPKRFFSVRRNSYVGQFSHSCLLGGLAVLSFFLLYF